MAGIDLSRVPARAGTAGRRILGLDGLVEHVTDKPMVALTRAVATSMVHSPAAGLGRLVAATSGWAGTAGSDPCGPPVRHARLSGRSHHERARPDHHNLLLPAARMAER
jgi:hypothetical protein